MRSFIQKIFCRHCGKYTKQHYLGKSKKSCNEIFTFLKFDLYECTECGELNED